MPLRCEGPFLLLNPVAKRTRGSEPGGRARKRGWALPQPSLGLEPGLPQASQRQFLPPVLLPFPGALSHPGAPCPDPALAADPLCPYTRCAVPRAPGRRAAVQAATLRLLEPRKLLVGRRRRPGGRAARPRRPCSNGRLSGRAPAVTVRGAQGVHSAEQCACPSRVPRAAGLPRSACSRPQTRRPGRVLTVCPSLRPGRPPSSTSGVHSALSLNSVREGSTAPPPEVEEGGALGGHWFKTLGGPVPSPGQSLLLTPAAARTFHPPCAPTPACAGAQPGRTARRGRWNLVVPLPTLTRSRRARVLFVL